MDDKSNKSSGCHFLTIQTESQYVHDEEEYCDQYDSCTTAAPHVSYSMYCVCSRLVLEFHFQQQKFYL